MITTFKENQVRESGVIYNGTFEQIKKLYAKNPEQAGELAIAAIELVLTGEISSDDYMIEVILENMKVVNEKNRAKYDKKVEAQKQKKLEENHLAEMAALYLEGWKQREIGEALNMSQQKVSYWLNIIRTDYPELLAEEDFTKNTKNTKKTADDTENVNENENVNETDIGYLGASVHQATRYLGASVHQDTGDEFVF